jgi:hypothetical protein
VVSRGKYDHGGDRPVARKNNPVARKDGKNGRITPGGLAHTLQKFQTPSTKLQTNSKYEINNLKMDTVHFLRQVFRLQSQAFGGMVVWD